MSDFRMGRPTLKSGKIFKSPKSQNGHTKDARKQLYINDLRKV